MLVFGMTVEGFDRRFDDMRSRRSPGGDSPSAILAEEGCFGLRAGEAELAGIARKAPCRLVFA
jgi:hypothetical protein